MERVEIRYRASAIYENHEYSIHGITMHVVKSGHNRFVADFDNLNDAVKYALHNGFEIVAIVRK